MAAELDPEKELENRLNQALNRFQTNDNLQTLNTAPTPSSPDVYDPFEPTGSPNSTISANFDNEQKADIDNDDLRRVLDKKQSFSSDEVSSKPRQVETTTQNTSNYIMNYFWGLKLFKDLLNKSHFDLESYKLSKNIK